LWGEYDNLIPGKQYAEKFLNDLSNAKLEVIPGSGHAPFAEKTSLVYERIQKFLQYKHHGYLTQVDLKELCLYIFSYTK
jgi:pimeloyl-ACP methyl ester carboxylesterase